MTTLGPIREPNRQYLALIWLTPRQARKSSDTCSPANGRIAKTTVTGWKLPLNRNKSRKKISDSCFTRPPSHRVMRGARKQGKNGLTLSLCTGRTWWFLYLKIPPIQWGLSFFPNRKPGVIRFKSPLLKSIRFKPTRVLYLYYEPHIFSSSDLWAFRWARQNTNTVVDSTNILYILESRASISPTEKKNYEDISGFS